MINRADMLVLGVALVATLTACQVVWPVAPGDYLVHVRETNALHAAFIERGGDPNKRIYGFQYGTSSPCQIWLRQDRAHTSTWPHEAAHCNKRNWHEKDKASS